VIAPLAMNLTVSNVHLSPYGWSYYSFDVLSATTTSLGITMQRTGGEGDPDLYVRFGELPTLAQFDYRNLDCDPCGQVDHTVRCCDLCWWWRFRLSVSLSLCC
jgi:hypothetical protein